MYTRKEKKREKDVTTREGKGIVMVLFLARGQKN